MTLVVTSAHPTRPPLDAAGLELPHSMAVAIVPVDPQSRYPHGYLLCVSRVRDMAALRAALHVPGSRVRLVQWVSRAWLRSYLNPTDCLRVDRREDVEAGAAGPVHVPTQALLRVFAPHPESPAARVLAVAAASADAA